MEKDIANTERHDAFTLRQTLVDELKRKGLITTPPVEAAFQAVPRHLFVPGVPLEEAYTDRAIVNKRLDGKWVSSSSQPAIMAIMLEQLGLEPGQKVLEIGTGTGYNAALIAHLVGETGRVVTIDIDEDIVAGAHERLAAAGLDRVEVICADGGYGYAEAAPYDRIILTVGAWDITPAWWEQLKPDGRLVLPLEIKAGQKSIAFEQVNLHSVKGNHLVSLSIKDCGFMTLRGDFAAPSVEPMQLGPDTGLLLGVHPEYPHPVGAKMVYEWLMGASKDWATGVEVTTEEIIGQLSLWLALHEPNLRSLRATDDMVDRNIVPPLVGFGGEWKSVATGVLIGKKGLAALMRPPGQPAPMADMDDLYADTSPFMLYVRQFGLDESLAQRLITLIQSWDKAGHPSSEELRVRVYPKGADYTSVEGEFVVEKQWTRLVLDWPAIS